MNVIDCRGVKFAYDELVLPGRLTERVFFWGHGWGQNRRALAPLAQSMSGFGRQILLDFPGFGQSSQPPRDWGTVEYADAVAEVIAKLRRNDHVIWVGHSFGGRIGIQLAARHPQTVDQLCLIAAAGLPRRRAAVERAVLAGRVYSFKMLKRMAPLLRLDLNALRGSFGSSDYKSAGEMRDIFVTVVRENLEASARKIKCPVQLIYGALDTETPPEIGERFLSMIPDATLASLEHHDHQSLLMEGRHQVARLLSNFVKAT